ncbi:MAG: cellobiose phosphorylase [Lachnospiraceae bacterium]|nr:cellobiose phosphorylase [Lachnospiraceae bacterium]
MSKINFLNNDAVFTIDKPENHSYLYFPVAGEKGIKGSITPNLGGDIKLDQNSFLLEPVSSENLHNNKSTRNFWCKIKDKGAWSLAGSSAEQEFKKFTDKQDDSKLEAGFMWQKLTRKTKEYGLKSEVLSFVPIDYNVELMFVTIENISEEACTFTPVAAVPIYGRSADNIRDHRHVTSLLHRIKTTDNGVLVKPTLSFDERGHRRNEITYFVCGITGKGNNPASFYPVVEDFIGEGGSFSNPRAIMDNAEGVKSGYSCEGKEALGGIKFDEVTLNCGEKTSYIIVMGATDNSDDIDETMKYYCNEAKVLEAKQRLQLHWSNQVNVDYKTGNKDFDGFMRWVSFQPFLRRIYGCSFLPHHDYGRGGRGWRDLWQDCLSLLIMDPSGVRRMIVDNYGGVRVDGTNATIIGSKQGEFIADRNGIARVWMDHGVWPFMTTMLYINQTGDLDILNETATYFKDEQKERGTALDKEWNESYGVFQKTTSGNVYKGTILEHILLEHLCSFYEVGEHNHIKLRGADWNDALDMAATNGESVAFTCAYAGNLSDIADLLLRAHNELGLDEVEFLEEIAILLEDGDDLYNSIEKKKEVLSNYLSKCGHYVSGNKKTVNVVDLVKNLKSKSEWIKKHIRDTEWIEGQDDSRLEGWFNSYYDDNKNRVEGYFPNEVRMMLTGQVFSVMSKTATKEQVEKICYSADKYLYKKDIGGYRLNTNFHEEKFDFGRMFGFAYGEKENGAVFSHMAVMYANALYQRGFVKEGYKALQSLADQAMDFEASKIYPGIPEYFDGSGRGLYHYLTGAASWYMLTFVTEVFGVKGDLGDLSIEPKLVKEQYDQDNKAILKLNFGGNRFEVTVINKDSLDYGEYSIISAICNDDIKLEIKDSKALLSKMDIAKLDKDINRIEIVLG